MRSFPSAARRAFAPSCIPIRYSTVPCNLDLLGVRREQVALHLERDSNIEKAHQPKVQFLRRTFGLQGSIGGGCPVASIRRASESLHSRKLSFRRCRFSEIQEAEDTSGGLRS